MVGLERQPALGSHITNFKANTLKEGRDHFTQGFLRSRIDLLGDYWRRFQEAHAILLEDAALLQDDYFTGDLLAVIELQYTSTLGFLYDEQRKLAQPPVVENTQGQGQALPVSIQLPKIQLPQFSGSIRDWESFRDIFGAMVHLRPSPSDVQRLHYLKVSVLGKAKAALDGLALIGTNYKVAWDLLLQRYEHKRLLVHHHMSTLAQTTSLKTESAEGLQSRHGRIVRAQESLQSLGMPTKEWDAWMVFFATSGLDAITRKDWEKSISSSENLPKFDSLKTFIHCRLLNILVSIREKHFIVSPPWKANDTVPYAVVIMFYIVVPGPPLIS